MTIELVDGKAGVEHISSEDKAIIHQAKFGKSDMVFDWGDVLKCTMGSANKATIGTGCASIQGLDWHITSAESVTISNGSHGMKRNDIICAHYHRDSKTGNELVELVVLKGSPNATAAADPTIPSGKILFGAGDAYMPLWRIPLDGITVGTPVRMFTPRGGFVGFRNPHEIKRQLGRELSHRVCRRDVDRRVSCHPAQHGLECREGMGVVQAFHASGWIGGRVRGALRRGVQFERGASWHRGAGRWQRDRPSLVREDDDRQRRLGRGLHHGAALIGD
ncbi:hypothetical protein [Bifidobacterium adolescentis]|uniref:hypothetical protein n=2 Tax=Bifidobacterium adolescentis TaxID=1680 RepID=UPI0034A4145E